MSHALLECLKLAPPHFPFEFIGGFAEMPALFSAICQSRCLPAGYAGRVSRLVPEVIASLPCFLDRVSGLWRYEYGEPITLATGVLIGTPMFPEVERLFDVLSCASWRLTSEKLQAYLVRLTDRAKHEDVLIEFAPVLRLSDDVIVDHEVSGSGSGNATVDWSIEAPGHPKLLLEVKNRIGDLVESFEAIKRQDSDQPIPEPRHDHAMLFKSVTHKFKSRQPDETIQAVWIKTGIKQEEADLRAAFGTLPQGRVHAAVLGTWDHEAYVLASDVATRRKVLRILKLRHCSRLVFQRSVEVPKPEGR